MQTAIHDLTMMKLGMMPFTAQQALGKITGRGDEVSFFAYFISAMESFRRAIDCQHEMPNRLKKTYVGTLLIVNLHL